MLRPSELFDGPILDPQSFERVVEAFSQASNFFYHGWDIKSKDQYPEYPLCVESDQGGFLVWIVGIVIGNRPGKALLVGCTKVRGYKDTIHSAFEILPGIPAGMDEESRKHALQALRRRMRFGTVLLAKKAQLLSHNDPSQEYNRGLLPALSNPKTDDSSGQWAIPDRGPGRENPGGSAPGDGFRGTPKAGYQTDTYLGGSGSGGSIAVASGI